MTDAPQEPTSGINNPETPDETQARFAAPTESYGQAPAPTDAFGQPIAPPPHSSDYAWSAAAPVERKRSARVSIIAALAVGALIGGVSGAGVAAWSVASNSGGQGTTSAAAPQNITVNDTESVNVVTAVAAKASPSVVTISVSGKSAAGTGSGIVLSKDGYVLTNTHVVTLDGEIANPDVQVTTADGHLYSATLVGTDPIADLAVIKLKNASNLSPATFADSSKLNVGETAVAIGAPLGLSNTVTDGIVSALNRSISIASSAAPSSGDSSTPDQNGQNGPFDFWQFDNGQGSTPQPTAAATISLPVIQTDAPINPGNSGGALLNSDAQVIGINVAIASAGGSSGSGQSGSIGVGFAIPANLAERVANEIIKDGKASHGLLGASVSDVTSSDSSSVVGAAIKSVTGGGAAADAGLKSGDIVVSFNGVPITSSTDLTAQVRFLAAGAKADLTYVRGGKTTNTSVTLGTLK
jgi:putative serine protease PepD